MAREIEVEIKTLEERTLHGLWIRSNIVSCDQEADTLMALYSSKVTHREGDRYIIRCAMDEKGGCELFAGGEELAEGLDELKVPEGEYVCTHVVPKFGFMWGGALDNADRFLRLVWPGRAGRELDDFRIEVRGVRGNKPFIDIYYKLK